MIWLTWSISTDPNSTPPWIDLQIPVAHDGLEAALSHQIKTGNKMARDAGWSDRVPDIDEWTDYDGERYYCYYLAGYVCLIIAKPAKADDDDEPFDTDGPQSRTDYSSDAQEPEGAL